ncbi:S66 family peptidase [Stackebrandtia nassauensis]|uniref:Peptidase U61 LD-carboxypeptidase A n=1 Tax=Stackebrandtia nassauensis (strain DSM 44728 / CIP 108903 / NRRL B-16338 / NBRC 102104 / LLR-40K-21) TaxID=446470 RepID=D3PZK2_STANL|nr:S66 peptidase family protein [Stackebrandtia nassauensis]ADD41676.1 peptidase U61 LD-carboxypeptidase A [Stackebrandtia nassauensis DSM 44728]
MQIPVYPAKPEPGDRVAVVSPASGLPGILPLPFELGLERLRDVFGLVPVEYPTTRKMGSSPAERAADLHAAFADESIKAIVTSIGGDDQITVLKHLDADVIRANPKPFFGYSDNTNLHAYLSSLGIVSYYGGAVMTEFGRAGALHPITEESLRASLFDSAEFTLRPSPDFTDVNRPWEDPATFDSEPEMFPSEGWIWRNADSVVNGRTWGGCLEIVAWLAMADLAMPPLDYLDGSVLFFETTEELPPDEEVFRILRNLGERGILGRCSALLMGRAKGWSFDKPHDDEQRRQYVDAQREAVIKAMDAYAPGVMTVFNVECGHTDPMSILPYGGQITVDGPAREITVRY